MPSIEIETTLEETSHDDDLGALMVYLDDIHGGYVHGMDDKTSI